MFATLTRADEATRRLRSRNTVLIVDDEEGICETLRDVFEGEGYTVCTVGNGRDALAVMEELPVKPCVVILDMIMPILDGNGVYRAMKADPDLADIPILISTSDPSQAPDGVLIMRKPIAVDVLVAAVRRCC
ncbi:MAG TPA: response regulator [Gemmatimonadales bacterium]|jgi:CheY-like chemotaxis protein|nr:response regulator [Gemmatimonadales bacterium]